MNIELRHLRYFVAVAEDASFSAAARRVHVAQQVLSTQIRQLESAVGTDLLRRTSRGVVLTPAGTAFLFMRVRRWPRWSAGSRRRSTRLARSPGGCAWA